VKALLHRLHIFCFAKVTFALYKMQSYLLFINYSVCERKLPDEGFGGELTNLENKPVTLKSAVVKTLVIFLIPDIVKRFS
jgi:hypothetical protein